MSTNLMPDDRRHLALRLTALQYIVAIAFAALAVGFWVFQVAQHQKFAEMAENNHLRKLPQPAPRGVLLDRNGKVLVENRNIFNIALVREQTKNSRRDAEDARRRHRCRRGAAPGDGQPAASRAELPAHRAHRKCQHRAGHRGEGAPVGASGYLLSGSAVAAVSWRHDGGASVRLRGGGHRSTASKGGLRGRRARRAGWTGRDRAGVQPRADGRPKAPRLSS